MAVKRRLGAEDGHDADDDDSIHPSRKRRLANSESDTHLAKCFNDLSDEVKSVRIKAAAAIVRLLSAVESSSLDRALSRLIRGLCSGRKAARSGFFIAFAEVLAVTVGSRPQSTSDVDFSVPALVERIQSLTQTDSSATKQEKRDHLLGRCTALQALAQSKIVFLPGVPISSWEVLLDHLLQLASEHVLLRKECGYALLEILAVMCQVQGLDKQYVSSILQKMSGASMLRTAEGVALWLTVVRSFPDVSLPKSVWHHNDPLASKDRSVLAKLLRDNAPADASNAEGVQSKSGAPQSSPHFAWSIVLAEFYRRYASSEKPADFTKFWIEAVDNSYFSASASIERKSVGFQVVSLAVASAPTALLPSLFSPNITRSIINQRTDASNSLHQTAKLPLTSLIARIKTSPEALPEALTAILGNNGVVNFDQLTKTRTIDELLSHVSKSSINQVLAILVRHIYYPEQSEHLSVDASQRIVADILLQLARKQAAASQRHNAANEADLGAFPWYDLLIALARPGYVAAAKPVETLVTPSDKIQELFRTRTMSCLQHILSANLDAEFSLPFRLALDVQEWSRSSSYSAIFKADGRILATINQTMVSMKDLDRVGRKSKDVKQRSSARALKLLFALSLLQAFANDPDAVSLLDDLDLCYTSWKQSEDASMVLIEVLLSLVSKPSALFRKLAEQVFGAFASQLTSDALQSMLDILEKKENLAGQQELFEQADEADERGSEESDGGEDSDIDIEDASDVEVVDRHVEGYETPGTASDDGSESSLDAEEDPEESAGDDSDDAAAQSEDEEAAAFETKLAQALGTTRLKQPGDDDESTSDDSDMDDEQMMALNGHLETIFRERTKQSSKKKDNKDAKENIVNLKNRVLDLLHIFAKQEYANILVSDLILPLLTLIRSTSSKQIGEKAFSLLRLIPETCNKHKRFPIAEHHSWPKDVLSTITEIHKEMRINSSKLHKNACSRSSLFLAKVLMHNDTKWFSHIADSYTQLQKDWYLDMAPHVQPSVFTEWTSWCIATKKR